MLKDLLNEIKGFKYQIILKVLLSKYTENTYREFGHVYFNSITKTVIGHEDSLGRSSQDVFNRIDNWISERSGWIIESIDAEYVNVSFYKSIIRKFMKEIQRKVWLISKNNHRSFLWSHTRY